METISGPPEAYDAHAVVHPQPVVDGWQKFKFGMTPAQINAQRLCAEKLVKIVSVEPEGPESDAFPCFPRGIGVPLTLVTLALGRACVMWVVR